MKFRLTISRKIVGTILTIFILSTFVLMGTQYGLYSRNVSGMLNKLEHSTLSMQQESAADLMREVKIAVEGSLQRGEYKQFMNFAEKQKAVDEIKAFSFYGKEGKAELSSDPKRVGEALDPQILTRARTEKDLFTTENAQMFSMCCALRVDADMRRLHPDWQVGDMYGVLQLEFSKEKVNEMLAEAQASYHTGARWTAMVVIVATLLAVVVVVGASLFIARRISRPLRDTVNVLKEIAQGEGDLTRRLGMRKVNCSESRKCSKQDCPEYGKKGTCWDTVGSNAPGNVQCPSILTGKFRTCMECPVMQSVISDETDEIAAWFNTFMGKLSQIIRKTTEDARMLGESSQSLTDTANQLAAGAEQTTAQSASVSVAAEEMSRTMSSMAASAEEMSSNIRTVGAAVEQMTASITEVARNAEQAAGVADHAAQLAATSNERIDELGSAASEIGKVIEVIQDIAEQTNLLALNATIEAARAGEAGKGFAVVATEVKELAKQTAEATEDIRKRIEAIQSTTGDTVKSIADISDVIKQVNEVSRTIASAVEEQSISTREIAQNVSQTASAADVVSQGVSQSAATSNEITRNIAGVDAAAKQTAEGAAHTKTAGEEVSHIAEELFSLVGKFKA
jgi:methyl-accepting chemotaxis protein